MSIFSNYFDNKAVSLASGGTYDDIVESKRGVEERYLGRLITSRRRFNSGPRNKYYIEQDMSDFSALMLWR